jgi:hypothetical protein
LEINSFELSTLERCLSKQGYIPDSADCQAARDAAYKIHEFYTSGTPYELQNSPLFLLLAPSVLVKNKLESASAKYDALTDLIHMVATREAKALAGQASQGADAAVKSEEA